MITELIEFMRNRCKATGISKAYQDRIASDKFTNVCAVRSITDGVPTNLLSGNLGYITQNFQVLYRGTKNRLTSQNIIYNVFLDLNNTFNTIFKDTRIISLQATAPVFAFVDEKGFVNYSITITANYNKAT